MTLTLTLTLTLALTLTLTPTLPLTLGFFNYEPSAHDDAYVALFAAEMRALCSTCAAAGQRALFFLASDQARCWRLRPEP